MFDLSSPRPSPPLLSMWCRAATLLFLLGLLALFPVCYLFRSVHPGADPKRLAHSHNTIHTRTHQTSCACHGLPARHLDPTSTYMVQIDRLDCWLDSLHTSTTKLCAGYDGSN
ncbi:hypothetical protein M440DRAFT_1103787 [Trichoderma longibrachiatum ATCC 18648]|uniref:Uncharacterized protein n=1 Tax=Trichoderma longibrachiatum ATCC 18648 TaxID=983965 RepID=A0A2T4BRS5_TRILO|nr:hypothetical protein M440DRAFT_1103787 [Trichoderma longibrachiatum ATCC 18648]